MKPHERPFVVGRRTRKGTTLVVLRGREPETVGIRGPWTLRAVVTPAGDEHRGRVARAAAG